MSQREEHIRDTSVNLLSQLRDKFLQVKYIAIPFYFFNYLINLLFFFHNLLNSVEWNEITCLQVLWNSSCLDSLLFSVNVESPSAPFNDPAWVATIRSLYQKVVREWIINSLSYAPCTSQGLLQVGETCFYPWRALLYILVINWFLVFSRVFWFSFLCKK